MDMTMKSIPVLELHESPWNPRKHFPPKALEELAESIRKVGILSPVLVRPRAAGGYEIAAGHRRCRAAKLAELTAIPTIVRPMADQEFLEILTIENLQREDVHPLEEGEGYRTLMAQIGWDADAVAAKVGKSKSYIYQRLKLAELIAPVKKAFYAEQLTAGHAVLLARLQPKDQTDALKEMELENAGNPWYEPMSVRKLSHWIHNQLYLGMVNIPWKKDDATLVLDVGPCSTCPKRSGNATELFPDLAKKDVCTDRECFAMKHAAHRERELAKASAKGETLLKLGDWSSRGDGYLKRGQDWTDDVKPKSCPHLQKGLVMCGGDAGRVLMVCAEKSCKTHHGGYQRTAGNGEYARKQKAEEAKRKRETLRRRRILEAIRGKITYAELSRDDLTRIAGAFFADIWAEYRKQIATMEGWYTTGKKGGSVWAAAEAAAKTQIPAMDMDGLARLLITMTLIKSAFVAPYDSGDKASAKVLADAAKRWGVDVGKIDAQEALEDTAKSAKATAKPKGNGKAVVQTAALEEPTCIVCGCTESRRCDDDIAGECCWVTLDKTTNAGLCSACELDPAKAKTQVAAFNAMRFPKAKIGKPTSGKTPAEKSPKAAKASRTAVHTSAPARA